MRFDKALTILVLGFSTLAAAGCGTETGDGSGGGSSTGAPVQNGPSGSGWGTKQSNATCADAPGFTAGTKQAGEACMDAGDCAPVCCPCSGGGSYWGFRCEKGLCAADGGCAGTEKDACGKQ